MKLLIAIPALNEEESIEQIIQRSRFWAVPLGFALVGLLLFASSLFDRVTTGMTYEHWSRYVVMSFCFALGIILSVTRVIDYVLSLVDYRLEYLNTQSTVCSTGAPPRPRWEVEAQTCWNDR